MWSLYLIKDPLYKSVLSVQMYKESLHVPIPSPQLYEYCLYECTSALIHIKILYEAILNYVKNPYVGASLANHIICVFM